MVCQRLQKFCGPALSRQTLNDGNRNSSIQSGGGGVRMRGHGMVLEKIAKDALVIIG